MAARRKRTTRRKQLSATQIVDRLKKAHPEVYAEVASPAAESSPLPAKLLQKVRKEAALLVKGISIVVPVQHKAFRVCAHLAWLDGPDVEFWIEEYLPNTKGALKNEKTLVSILDDVTRNEDYQSIEEDVREDVVESQEYQRFAKRCSDFHDELARYENDYGFNYYNDVGRYV